MGGVIPNPNGVAAQVIILKNPPTFSRAGHNPFGVDARPVLFTQGSSFLATLGFEPQSLRDWPRYSTSARRVAACSHSGLSWARRC